MGLDVVLYEAIKKEDYREESFAHRKLVLDSEFVLEKCQLLAKHFYYENIEYIDFETLFKKKKLVYSDYTLVAIRDTEWKKIYSFVKTDLLDVYRAEQNHKKYLLNINVKRSCPVKTVEHPVLYLQEKGYQRKGANQLFYDEGNWDTGGYITTLKECEEHYLRYFAPPWIQQPTLPVDKDYFDYFKENILKKFIDGENVLLYC